jgi:hypothetical protein
VVGRCQPGGSLRVLEILKDHRRALVYDLRSRFGVGYEDIGTKVPWNELVDLVAVLVRDPTSWLQTSISGWKHPISYDWTVLAAMYDLHAQVHSKRTPTPFPRPWPDHHGQNNRPVLRDDAREILKRAKEGKLTWQSKHTRM